MCVCYVSAEDKQFWQPSTRMSSASARSSLACSCAGSLSSTGRLSRRISSSATMLSKYTFCSDVYGVLSLASKAGTSHASPGYFGQRRSCL